MISCTKCSLDFDKNKVSSILTSPDAWQTKPFKRNTFIEWKIAEDLQGGKILQWNDEVYHQMKNQKIQSLSIHFCMRICIQKIKERFVFFPSKAVLLRVPVAKIQVIHEYLCWDVQHPTQIKLKHSFYDDQRIQKSSSKTWFLRRRTVKVFYYSSFLQFFQDWIQFFPIMNRNFGRSLCLQFSIKCQSNHKCSRIFLTSLRCAA